jgi:ABC-2 type transport system ATP-binding protein
LDVQAGRIVKNWIRELAQVQGKTIILTTHQLNLAQELCAQVAIIHKGRILTHEPVEAMLRRFRGDYYELRLAGPPPPGLGEEFPPLSLAAEEAETTWLGMLADQGQVYALLETLHQANAHLLSFRQVEPDLEEIFIRLVEPPLPERGRP